MFKGRWPRHRRTYSGTAGATILTRLVVESAYGLVEDRSLVQVLSDDSNLHEPGGISIDLCWQEVYRAMHPDRVVKS